jgi:hypothetical protein
MFQKRKLNKNMNKDIKCANVQMCKCANVQMCIVFIQPLHQRNYQIRQL